MKLYIKFAYVNVYYILILLYNSFNFMRKSSNSFSLNSKVFVLFNCKITECSFSSAPKL